MASPHLAASRLRCSLQVPSACPALPPPALLRFPFLLACMSNPHVWLSALLLLLVTISVGSQSRRSRCICRAWRHHKPSADAGRSESINPLLVISSSLCPPPLCLLTRNPRHDDDPDPSTCSGTAAKSHSLEIHSSMLAMCLPLPGTWHFGNRPLPSVVLRIPRGALLPVSRQCIHRLY